LSEQPGRSCPLDYRYRPHEIARAAWRPELTGLDTLYVAGGLYGNLEALQVLLEAFAAEPGARKALVFNGDFHWFDAEPGWFAEVQQAVDRHTATRGNVETELARPSLGEAGCGCAYPDWVGEATVAHSNRIIQQLHAAVPEALRAPLGALPPFLRAEVGGVAVGIVHGDFESLAGWGLSQEALLEPQARQAALRACKAAEVRFFASSHSCLPVLQALGGGRWVLNNGAAGMPNLAGERRGLFTRIARSPAREAVAEAREGGLHLALCPLAYDTAAWQRRFEARWPEGSDAERSYGRRIREGTDYALAELLRAA
jgi:hypothetical protein